MNRHEHNRQYPPVNMKRFQVLLCAAAAAVPLGRAASPAIQHVLIEPATAETPRSDTASMISLPGGRLMVVYHKYHRGKEAGRDHGLCTIWSKFSTDNGLSWRSPRRLVDVAEGDMNVQAPALLRTQSGNLFLVALRAHRGGNSSTMCLFVSRDDGATFTERPPIWKRSRGQLLQGGASSLLELTRGRLLVPFHGGTGNQWRQKNSAGCFYSDDNGRTWQRSSMIELPKRGAMEGSVVELADGSLLMSLRTQLGGPHFSRSHDRGKTWSKAVFSGLEGGESGTCLRRLPGGDRLVLFWNNSRFEPKHHHFGERTPLSAAVSDDHGKTWRKLGNIGAEPNAEYTNLDCHFTGTGDAILTYMYAEPAWNRKAIHLKAALIPNAWFVQPAD
ncbi:MAG: sialidase family protein [Verrucomicrobiota bacterium]|nr:sialidase family protein [Verrucomicrobiota bacterium]